MTNLNDIQDDAIRQAVRVVLAMLPQDGVLSPEEVERSVDQIHSALRVDRDTLLRHVQALVSIFQDDSTGLDDPRDHVEWLLDSRAGRQWNFWDRYRRYLQDAQLIPPMVVTRTDTSTDRILGKLEDPLRGGQWRRTGLVVGQVQSGKTGNYIGLACKAVDAGYRLVVVLAGSWNNLRSQTQLRVDEGLLGFDTQYQQRSDDDSASSRIGVGAIPGFDRLKIASLTMSAEQGDFKRTVAANMNIPIGDYPVVLVVKKHRSILENLRKWIVEVEGEPTSSGADKVIRGVPILVIDDEADNASVNTRDENTEPSAINKAIRRLLNSFERSAYVGYTATPFANIYIKPSDGTDQFGFDIFPDSFIESLPAPSNYLGPERVFGLRTDDPDDDVDALPIFHPVDDHIGWMPDRHTKSWSPPDDLPGSLRAAVLSFVLTCAARRARGQVKVHNSMLVHVTRFQQVQNRVAEQIDGYVRMLHDSVRDTYGDAHQATCDELRQLWENDYIETSRHFPADEVDSVTWEQVLAEVRPALAKIRTHAINGTSSDALEYYDNRRTGLSVIAVGGDKLSRGLTLEGLSISYYLRSSKAYDTLLQMGRWFGYRPGYEGLCRLYTTRILRDAYVEITAANDELRRDFEEMSTLRATPRDFGLRVRASSAGLAVTAPNKMRRGVKVKLSYSGDLAETVTFDLRDRSLRDNLDNLESFLARLDEISVPISADSGARWAGIPSEEIVDRFLARYVADRQAHRVRPAFIAEYIRGCARFGELSNWTVQLAGRSGGEWSYKIGHRELSLYQRRPLDPLSESEDANTRVRYSIKRILSPRDERIDLDRKQRELALAGTKNAAVGKVSKQTGKPLDPRIATGRPLRRVRRPDQPLLLIYPLRHPASEKSDMQLPPVVGFAISFPFSAHATETEYVVNDVWRQQQFDVDDEDFDQ